MNKKLEHRIILLLILILVFFGITACSRGIQNCEFNPGVTVEQKTESKEDEPKKESEIESKLPVKVSPKGEISCSF